MRQYLWNLWMALTGSNPCKVELDEVREKYEKTAKRVGGLQNMYYSALEKYDEISKQVKVLIQQRDELTGLVEKGRAQEQSLQQLVENLRERLKDREGELELQAAEYRERMERMKRGYQQRIDEYTREIDRLKNTQKQ